MCDVRISCRNMDGVDFSKEKVEKQVLSATKVFDRASMSATVTLKQVEGAVKDKKFVCDIKFSAPRCSLFVSESGSNVRNAVDDSCAKLERALRKHKTKIVDKRRKTVVEPVLEVAKFDEDDGEDDEDFEPYAESA